MSRVLVVDDDPDLRALVSIRLQKEGHRVVGADSAAEALAFVAQRGAPDVAVLDVTMPGMTGLELLPAMRALDATYLTKPFSAVALCKAVERLAPVEAGW